MDFAVGQGVQARGLEWDILEVEPLGAQLRLRLRCRTGDMRGLEWDLLHPFEPVAPLRTELNWSHLVSLKTWRLHHVACLLDQVFAPDALVATQPGRLQMEPYQLVPLMRALELPRARLLLADDVGLGKTVQAGLIVTELIARRQAHRVLVVAPSGPLLLQWQQELRYRFGLRFTAITDSASLEAQRRGMELGGNPFERHALTLVALDFAKQERVLQELERAAWDIAIIDEAHHCISAGAEREDTLRRRLAEVVARRSDTLLLLTATPHDGYDPHFASLIALLDPSLVDGKGGLVGNAYRRHVVRRLKSHLRDAATGAPLFKARVVKPVRVDVRGAALAPVRAFHHALAALVAPRLRRAERTRDEADTLAFIGLLKRSVSTIRACVNTLRVVAERYGALADDPASAAALRRERARALRAWRRRSLRFGTLDAAEEGEAAQLEAEHIAAELHTGAGETMQSLRALIAHGETAAARDPKLHALLRQVREIRAAEPGANVLIYTEYADSQAAAADALRGAADIAGEVLTISGVDTEEARTRAAERCAEQDGVILVSTDSLAEGLNLQQRCRHLIHLDLPYNPNRLEQRNGRIDRYGQRGVPEIRYLYLAGTFEERLLLRLIGKYEKARARLTDMPATLGVDADPDACAQPLVRGFAEEQAKLFDGAPSPIRTLDQAAEDANAESYRDLLHAVDRAFQFYERDAVRHGWFAGQGLHAEVANPAEAEAALRRGERELGGVDLAAFVNAVFEGEAAQGAERANRTKRNSPSPCGRGLGGGVVRTGLGWPESDHPTPPPAPLPQGEGEFLCGALGRANPLVRRAIVSARQADGTVTAAWGSEEAVLLTFGMEMHSANQIALRRVIAVLVPREGKARVLSPPDQWLGLADPNEPPHAAASVPRWLTHRQAEAERAAQATAHQLADAFAAEHERRTRSETEMLNRWLAVRANEICGPPIPAMPDLFGAVPDTPAWKHENSPAERLAGCALDDSIPSSRRREANGVLELFRRRETDRRQREALSPPIVRPLGVLVLMPRDRVP